MTILNLPSIIVTVHEKAAVWQRRRPTCLKPKRLPIIIGFFALTICSTGFAQSQKPIDSESMDPSGPTSNTAEGESAKPKVTQADIARALRRYAKEPSVQKVVEIALKTMSSDPKKAEEMASRARDTGWLPIVRFGVRRGLGQGSAQYQTVELDKTSLSTDDDFAIEGSLTFELDRLVFDRNEVAIAREERSARETQSKVIRAVISLYFERRRLQLERDLGQASDIAQEVRIAEIEAILNSFTNGAFGSMISQKNNL
jgi:hypothetical protein